MRTLLTYVLALFLSLLFLDQGQALAQEAGAAAAAGQTAGPAPVATPTGSFTNPLLPAGADPSVVRQGDFYYYMQTTGRDLTIWKTQDLTNLKDAEKKVVWIPPVDGPYSKDIWAPELHFLKGKWYIYFAADAGTNETHRIWVLENSAADPLEGVWAIKGKLADKSDKWAIDPSVFEVNGKDYALWAGWPGDVNGVQDIFIARLKNPWTIKGSRKVLSTPQYPWEKVGDLSRGENGVIPYPHVDVNEGPEVLEHGGKVFIVYSASGCWTNYYELGMLTASEDSNLLKGKSWAKSAVPVFWESPEAGVFAPGHNTFFKSPDGREDWILYHANAESGLGCGEQRSPRAQKIVWKADGSPDFGRPISTTETIVKPSGTR
jgi:GH43 family beta-xylosidase